MRTAGILLPVSSLASRFGIGCFSREAYEFIDFLYNAGQGAWQVLPIGPTGFKDSPYQPVSAFAGNPYFISIEDLVEEGLLTWDEVNDRFYGDNAERIDYGAIYASRPKLLRIASDRFFEHGEQQSREYTTFVKKSAAWLPDYAMYMALKELHGGKSWQEWDDPYRTRDPEAIAKAEITLQENIVYYYFEQFQFDKQRLKLRDYANRKNIRIIGDVPFYMAMDSVDTWSNPEVFKLNKDLTPKAISGCPPDAFSPTGQLWGNPLYDWDALKSDGYSWWLRRIRRNLVWFDTLRIDHFHGFSEYYEIPADEKTAVNGIMMRGPGMDFIAHVHDLCDTDQIIAEDLGTRSAANVKLMQESGFAGMKVLQYGFTSWDSVYLTHRHEQNSVVYTGTHDNIPVRAWVERISNGEREFARAYLNSVNTDYGQFTWDFIREAYRSVADLCIVPIQDYLVLGSDTRINDPGRGDGNWIWRIRPGSLSDALCFSIRRLSETYGRVPPAPEPDDETTNEETATG